MKKRHRIKNAWWVSPFGDLPDLRRQTTAGDVQLYDYTLRGWGRSYGIVYDATEARRIVDALAAIGVERIELALPCEGAPRKEDIRALVGSYPDIPFSARLRGSKKELQEAADCGIQHVLIGVPLGQPQLKYRLGWTWQSALEKMVEAADHAGQLGLQVTAVPEDIARANPDDLDRYLKALHRQADLDALCIEDSTGCALPQVIDLLVRRARQHVRGTPIHVAGANDFGLATACALSGVLAGAQTAYGSLNGLGQRLGGAPTEELLLGLKILLGAPGAWAVEHLHEACLLVEEITGIPIPDNKPFAGHRSYFSEHAETQSPTEHPLLSFCTDPRLFGRTTQNAPVPKPRRGRPVSHA